MKKAKHIALTAAILVLALLMSLTLSACSTPGEGEGGSDPTPTAASQGNEPGNDLPDDSQSGENVFKSYSEDQWLAESFDGKTISYQFVSPEVNSSEIGNGFAFAECINLYSDGSVLADHRNVVKGTTDRHFGYWSFEEGDYGNVITLNIGYVVALNGISLLPHEYEYSLYEEAGGTYSFSFDYGITPGAYFRTIGVEGSANVVYSTLDDFHAAVDVILETYRYESVSSTLPGFTGQISIFSNNTVALTLFTEYNGANTAVANAEGTLSYILNEAGNGVDGYSITGSHSGLGEFNVTVPADYSGFTWDGEFMANGFSFDMQPVEIPAE